MLNFLSYLGLPLSKKKAEPPKPRQKAFISDIADKIEEKNPFAIVHIIVDEGDDKFICGIVKGKFTGAKRIGVIVPYAQDAYVRLQQLANAPFDSRIRVGVADYDGKAICAGKLFAKAQSYESKTYLGCKPVPVQEPSYAVA